MSINKLHIEADGCQFGTSVVNGDAEELSQFISEIMEQHAGIRDVIRKSVMNSSLRFDIRREVEAELENEASEIAQHLAVVIKHQPGTN